MTFHRVLLYSNNDKSFPCISRDRSINIVFSSLGEGNRVTRVCDRPYNYTQSHKIFCSDPACAHTHIRHSRRAPRVSSSPDVRRYGQQ